MAHLDAQRCAVPSKFRLPAAEQGTHDIARARLHAHETVQTRAAQKMQQHRLRLIVRMMRDGDRLCTDRCFHATQEGIAQLARRRLQRKLPLSCIARHICRLDRAGDAPRTAERSDMLRILARCRATDAVLEVRDMHGKSQPIAQAQQKDEQRHRVHAARDGDDDGRTVRKKPVLLAKIHDLLQHEAPPLIHTPAARTKPPPPFKTRNRKSTLRKSAFLML